MKRRERIQRIIIFVLLIGLLVTQSPFDISAAVKCKSVALNVTKATIGVGDILPLTAVTKPLNATGNQKWTSSDKKVATVNKYGAVTGVGEGTAKITVKIGKKKATCAVTVVKAETGTDIKQELVNYPTKSEVYTKEEVDKLVAEKVKEATKGIDFSSYAAKKDVYTKAEVDKLIEDKVKEIESSSGGETKEKDWEDGTELKCDNVESLPKKIEWNTFDSDLATLKQTGYILINSVKVQKYHNYNEIKANQSRYLYRFTIKGKLRYPILTDNYTENPVDRIINYASLDFALYNSKGYGTYSNYIGFEDENFKLKVDENEEFEATIDIEGNYYDCDMFSLRELQWTY